MAKGDLQFGLTIDGGAAERYVQQWVSDVKNQTKQLSDEIQKALGGPPIKKELQIITTTDENGVKKQVTQLKEVGRITDTINQQWVNANKLQDGSVTRLRQQVNEAKQARDAISKIGKSADDLKTKINSINPAWDLANQKVRALSRELEIASASSFWQRIKAEFNLGPIVGAGKALNEIVNTFQSLSIVVGQLTAPIIALSNALNEIQQIDLLFKGIGGGPAEISKIFADSSRIALEYGVNLKTVRESFTQLTPVILASGGSLENVSQITSALSSRFATFGLSADKSRRVMNGVIQAFGKGKLMAEELTQQISEADPAFKTDLANAIGVTVAQLGEMVKAGEITSQVLLEVLPLLAKNSVYFGKLGTSATSAVAALGRGQATIEQVKNQLATLSQLNLESLAGLFKPLLGAFLQVQAAVVDFITNLRKLEVVKSLISVVNSLAVQLAGIFTAFTNVIIIVGKFVDPIFAAINAVDDFSQKLVGFKVLSAAVAAIITGLLIKSIVGLAATAIPKAITGIQGLATSLGILNGQSLMQFVTGIANGVKSMIAWIASAGQTIAANIAQAASYKTVTAAALATAAAKEVEANAGNLASKAAANAIRANKGVESSLNAVDAASGAAAGGFKLTAGAAAAAAAVLGVVAYAFNTYKTITEQGDTAAKNFDEGLKQLRAEMAATGTEAQNAATDTEMFANKLKDLAAQTRDRNVFDVVVDVVFMTDMNTAIAVLHAKAELNKRFKDLEKNVEGTKQRLQEYNAAQDKSGAGARALKQEILNQVKAYDLLIQEAIKARNELAQKAATSGAGLDPKEIIALKKFQEDIEKFRKARDGLIEETQAKGIQLDVKLSTEGEEQVITTIAGIDAELKSIKETTTVARIGEEGAEETENKIKGLDGLLKFIQENPVTVKIKAQFDIDKAAIASQIEYGQAMIENTRSRGELEGSIFGIYKARNSFAIQTAQEELQSMKDRKVSAEQIKQKENEIAQLKDNERKIEQAAILKKLQNIGTEQQLERQVLELKQQGQRLEAQMAIDAANQLAIQARIAEQIAIQNKLKAQATKDPTDDAPAAKLVDYAKQYVEYADKGVNSAKQRYNTLTQTQALEKDTLNNQQAAARNNLNAQAAQVGLNSTIDKGAQSYGNLNKESAGFISAGGKTVQVYNELGNEIRQTGRDAGTLGQQLNSLPRDQSLNIGLDANLDPQSVNQAVSEGQAALDQPGRQLTTPLKPTVDTVGFYNEVRQAVQTVQSSDATKVSAQLKVEGQEMAAASIQSLSNSVEDYKTKVETANQAQGQLNTAISNYNEALKSGDPTRILETAGALSYQRQVVEAANIDLQNAKANLQDADATAKVLGVNIGNVGTQASNASQQITGIGSAISTSANEITNYTSQLENFSTSASQGVQNVGTGLNSLKTEAQEFVNTLSGAPQAFGEIGIAAGESANGINGISENLAGVSENAENAGDAFMSISTGAGEAADAVDDIPSSLEGVGDSVDGLAGSFSDAADYAGQVVESGFDGAAENASIAGDDFSNSLSTASTQADEIYSTLSNIDGLNPTVTVNVVGTPGRFAGGPVDSGQMYRVNELGKEAFLSASGRLSMINKPKNALWRAPSRGTVIPAHLTAGLSIPSSGVSVAAGASRRVSSAVSNMSNSASIARAVTQALRASGLLETNNSAAANQAGQAVQLGKLTHAVNKLVDKDWNVQVNVKNPSPSAYVNMINRLS